MDRLCMVSAKDVPSYVQIMIDALAETRKELLETRKELAEMSRRNDAILEENKKLREENSLLKLRIEELLSISKNPVSPPSNISPPVTSHNALDNDSLISDPDFKRSIVVKGVPESRSRSAYDNINHDWDCVMSLLDFLDIACFPKTLYRMGRPKANAPRLLKVVLPSSQFQRLILKRKSQLRFFPQKGVYVRPSLPPGERNFNHEKPLMNNSAMSTQTAVTRTVVDEGRVQSQSPLLPSGN